MTPGPERQPDPGTTPETPSAPFVQVVKGSPSDEEVAALVAVLASRGSARPEAGEPETGSGWSAYWRSVRRPLHPGPGAWRMSGRG